MHRWAFIVLPVGNPYHDVLCLGLGSKYILTLKSKRTQTCRSNLCHKNMNKKRAFFLVLDTTIVSNICFLKDKYIIINHHIISSRMMAMRPGAEQNMMVEVNYRQGHEGTVLDTLVQDVYLCASMEFLLTVADIFLKATQQGFAQGAQPKNFTGAGEKKNINSSVTSKDSSEFFI